MISLYDSVEVASWSRNFDYKGYLHLHEDMKCLGGKLSYEGYKELCQVLDNEIRRDMEDAE